MRQSFSSVTSARPAGVRGMVLAAVLAACMTVATGHAQGPAPQGVFHTGATAGIIRDATKVGPTIYAVGTWANSGAGGRIDGALWTFAGATPPTRTALPDLGAGGGNLAAGEAITPDAQFIASQVRNAPAPPPVAAARIARDLGTSVLSALNLTPTTTFPTPAYTGGGRFARSISDDGTVVYGQVNRWLGLTNPDGSRLYHARAMRFDVSGATVTGSEIFPQPATNAAGYQTFQSIQSRGASADGSVAIGSTFSSADVVDQQGFRYVHGVGSTPISLLGGGTFSAPLALSDDGSTVLLKGDSTAFPLEEIFLARYNGAGAEQITPLGSPNEPWASNIGGLNADGSVFAVSMRNGQCSAANPCRYGYLHNANGWFQLPTAMAAAGMDLTGWEKFQVQGMSGDGTLVWGSGFHNGAEEGYVAEFPAGFLQAFDVVPAPPSDASIVGVWSADGTGDPSTSAPASVAVFMRDGTYYQIDPTGFERGSYSFNGSLLRTATRLDTNGDGGLSDSNGQALAVSVVGDELRSPANCVFDAAHPDNCFVARRIPGAPGQIDGGWVLGDPAQADSSAVIVFTASGKYFFAQDGNPAADPGGRDGIEIGQAAWDAATGVVAVGPLSEDTNGEWGLSNSTGPVTAALSADGLALLAGDNTGKQTLTRIVDPATVVPVVNEGSITAVEGSALTYQVVATRALTYAAAGLPGGLSIDQATGEISGTPSGVWGPVDVTITATNTFGDQGSATLHFQIDDLTPPVISGTPSNISVAATGPSGAIVTWPAPAATDARDGSVPVACAPASGSLFPKGTTQVTCTAADAAGNSDATSFYVTVGQPSPPSFTSVPLPQQVEATGPAGAAVLYGPAPAAVDAFGQPLVVACAPANGSTLALGQTKVTCTATDANALSASVQFFVTVVDTAAPVFLTIPSPVTVEATSNKGAVVTYSTPTVSDLVDPLPTMKCDKASGQTYPLGITTVACTTADRSGNARTQTFTISVTDTTAPTVTITKPVSGATYRKGQKLAANFACTDAASGVQSCAATVSGPSGTATVVDGGLISTSAAGDYTFSVVGKDVANNTRTSVVTFKVQ